MTTSNIATAINAAHDKVETHKREGTRYAIEAGRLLTEAKETVLHGKWDAWLRANCTFSARTARAYMQVFDYVGTDPAKRQRAAEISFRALSKEARRLKDAPVVPAEIMRHVIDFTAVWVSSPFQARKAFLDALVQRGGITPVQYVGMMRGADSEAHTIGLLNGIDRDFGRDGLATLADNVPFALMDKAAAAKLKGYFKDRGI